MAQPPDRATWSPDPAEAAAAQRDQLRTNQYPSPGTDYPQVPVPQNPRSPGPTAPAQISPSSGYPVGQTSTPLAPPQPRPHGLTGWHQRRASREAATPTEIRVARMGVRSALIGALIGALGVGALSYLVQVREESNQVQAALIESRQSAYGDLVAASADFLSSALEYAVVATVEGETLEQLDAADLEFSETMALFFRAAAGAELVASDDVAASLDDLVNQAYGIATELWLSVTDNLSGEGDATLDAHFDTYLDLSAEFDLATDNFIELARADIGTET